MIIILQLWQAFGAVKGPFVAFLFFSPEEEKRANFFEGVGSPSDERRRGGISARLFAEGCQWASLMVCRCRMVKTCNQPRSRCRAPLLYSLALYGLTMRKHSSVCSGFFFSFCCLFNASLGERKCHLTADWLPPG